MLIYGMPPEFFIVGLLSIILIIEFLIWSYDDWRK